MDRFRISTGLLAGLAQDMEKVATHLVEELGAQNGKTLPLPIGTWWWGALPDADRSSAGDAVLEQARTHAALITAHHHWEALLKDLVSLEVTRFLGSAIQVRCDGLSMNQLSALLDEWGLQMKVMPSWQQVDDLRHIANTIKHGYGHSSHKLYRGRPEYFGREIATLRSKAVETILQRMKDVQEGKTREEVLEANTDGMRPVHVTGDPASLAIERDEAERLIRGPAKLLDEMKTAASAAAVSFMVSHEERLGMR